MQTLSVSLTTGQSDSFSGATFVQILSWEELKTSKGTVSPLLFLLLFFFSPFLWLNFSNQRRTWQCSYTMSYQSSFNSFKSLTSRGVRGGVLIVLIGHKDGITEGWSSRASGWRGMCMNELCGSQTREIRRIRSDRRQVWKDAVMEIDEISLEETVWKSFCMSFWPIDFKYTLFNVT